MLLTYYIFNYYSCFRYKKYVQVNNLSTNVNQLAPTGQSLNRNRSNKASATITAASFFTTSLQSYGSGTVKLKVPTTSIEVYEKYCSMTNLHIPESKSLKLIEDYVNMY